MQMITEVKECVWGSIDKVNHNSTMDWVSVYLQKKKVKNLNLTEIISLFGNEPIHIQNYDLVCSGKTGGIRKHEFFRIISANSDIFAGAHTVIWRDCELSVTSLSALKRNILKITDLTSFERSTYLILHEYKRLVRIKNIRFMLCCPKVAITKAYLTPSEEFNNPKLKKCRYHNTDKQMQEYVEKMVILHKNKQPEDSIQSILQIVNHSVQLITSKLLTQLECKVELEDLTDIFTEEMLNELTENMSTS